MDQEKTVRLTGDETVALTGEPTVSGAGEPTMRLSPGETASAAGGETVTIAGEPTVRISAQPTVHLAPPPAGNSPPARTTAGTRYVTGRADGTRAGDAPQAAEVRFGPGVPTPATAPAWRPAAPARRRRLRWRLVSSILSSLLTVALLVVVGLYLWQRLSPLEVTSVTAAVPKPPGDACDVTVDVVATVRTNGNAGDLRYQWLRSGTEPTAVLTERVGRGQRTVTLHLKWAFSGVGTTTETATVNITEPAAMQAQTEVVYDCQRR